VPVRLDSRLSVPDVLIIGGGPAGYVAGIRAAQLNARVTIVENDIVGGTCLNRGCIPTKILVERARLLTQLRSIQAANVKAGKWEPELKEIMEIKRLTVERIVKGTKRLLDSYGIEILQGSARITGPREVRIASLAGTQRLAAKNLIIATGSSPQTLPIPGCSADGVLIGEEILGISERPNRLVIIGGGGIGVEFACIFNALGTKVTIIELMSQILPNEDTDMAQYLHQILESKGIDIYTDAKIKEINNHPSGTLSVRFSSPIQEKEIETDKVLVSVGRKPNIQNLGLDNLNIELEHGWIKTDSHMRTNCTNTFASGDVVGKYLLAYVAWAEGIVAAENTMGRNSEIDYSVIPRCTFSDPQLASVGLTENQARSRGINTKVGAFSFSDNSRAVVLGEENGGIKIITDSDSGEILGAQIMGPQAAELINGIALAMKLEATIQDIGNVMCVHPTLFELIKEAALDVENRAIHRTKK
jgi:dihydrolipoamide dehydrogenase